jgi:hypothetical protein
VEKVAVVARSTMASAEKDLITFSDFPRGPFCKKQGLFCNFYFFEPCLYMSPADLMKLRILWTLLLLKRKSSNFSVTIGYHISIY